jgi:hypothetical protein
VALPVDRSSPNSPPFFSPEPAAPKPLGINFADHVFKTPPSRLERRLLAIHDVEENEWAESPKAVAQTLRMPTTPKSSEVVELPKTPETRKRKEVTSSEPKTPEQIFSSPKVATPDGPHDPNFFDGPENKKLRKTVKSLERKQFHCFLLGSAKKEKQERRHKDVSHILMKNLEPDENGEYQVNGRKYKEHAPPSSSKKLIPVEGRNILRLTGAEAKLRLEEYQQSGAPSFEEYLLSVYPSSQP